MNLVFLSITRLISWLKVSVSHPEFKANTYILQDLISNIVRVGNVENVQITISKTINGRKVAQRCIDELVGLPWCCYNAFPVFLHALKDLLPVIDTNSTREALIKRICTFLDILNPSDLPIAFYNLMLSIDGPSSKQSVKRTVFKKCEEIFESRIKGSVFEEETLNWISLVMRYHQVTFSFHVVV